MTSYIHIPILIACFFVLLSMQRWWLCISRMGFVRELGRRAPALVRGDILAVTFAVAPFVIAVLDWLGFAMQGQTVIASLLLFFSLWHAWVLAYSCWGIPANALPVIGLALGKVPCVPWRCCASSTLLSWPTPWTCCNNTKPRR